MVTSTLSVSSSGSIITKGTGNIMTQSSKVDLRLDTVLFDEKSLPTPENSNSSRGNCFT